MANVQKKRSLKLGQSGKKIVKQTSAEEQRESIVSTDLLEDKAAVAEAIVSVQVVNPHAAGIDVGSRSHYVAIGQKSSDVREFGVYTHELDELCQYLVANHITTVALESTGTYWQHLFLKLQDYGLRPILVSGKFTKNVQGKKTDVLDCQYIQKMHSMGFLPSSFQPDAATETLRSYVRQREGLIADAASCKVKMQKALRMMNIRLDIVLSDITGVTGTAIVEAILKGETKPSALAGLAHHQVKKTQTELEASLKGIFRKEYLFELKQVYALYQVYQTQIAAYNVEISAVLQQQIADNEGADGEERPEFTRKPKRQRKNAPSFDIEKLAFQLTGGIDLAVIDGLSGQTLLTIISEIGLNIDKFASAKRFASWLRLSPNNKITGGKIQSSRTPKGKGRLAHALMHVANVIGTRSKSGHLHAFFQRIKIKKGGIQAVVATAHKLAVIIWNMLSKKEPYIAPDTTQLQEKQRQQSIRSIQRKMRNLDIKLEDLNFAAP